MTNEEAFEYARKYILNEQKGYVELITPRLLQAIGIVLLQIERKMK